MIVDIASGIRLDYNLSAKTLWDSQAPNDDNGIRVAADVKVVLTQTNKNKETTDYYEGAELWCCSGGTERGFQHQPVLLRCRDREWPCYQHHHC